MNFKSDDIEILYGSLVTFSQGSSTTTDFALSSSKPSSTFVYIVSALFIAIVTWVLRSYYEKYIALRPRLFIKLGKPLYGQRLIDYNAGHELTWRHQCVIKNNSQIPAYNIEMWEITSKGRKPIINNFPAVKLSLPVNNHLDKHEQKDIELKSVLHTDPSVLLIFTTNPDGSRLYTPGLKIKSPQTELMPTELNDIKLVLKYQNEKGKTFYTKFRRKDNKESNSFHWFRPYRFRTVLK